jgi:hypothetical protein
MYGSRPMWPVACSPSGFGGTYPSTGLPRGRGLIDWIIAAVAWRHGASLLARDADMDGLARVRNSHRPSVRTSPVASRGGRILLAARYAELQCVGNQIDEFISGRARGDGGAESAQQRFAGALLDAGQGRGTSDHPPIGADD